MLQEHLALSFIDYYRRLNLWDIIIAFITFKFRLEKDTSRCYVMVVRNQQFFFMYNIFKPSEFVGYYYCLNYF